MMHVHHVKKALVTGANGFIGTHLCKKLNELGIPTNALIMPNTPTKDISLPNITLHYGNITDKNTLLPALEGVSHVFHLAALTSDWAPYELFYNVNFLGTKNLIDASIEKGVVRFLLTSSVSVHKYSGHLNSDETAPRDGNINGYAKTKIMCEDYLHSVQNPHFETVVIRPGLMPFGPGDRLSFGSMLTLLKKHQFAYVNHGQAKMCFSYVENLVEGMILACTHPNGKGETFILSDDDVLTWKEFIEDVCQVLNVKPPFLHIPYICLVPITFILEFIWKTFDLKSAPPLTFYRISVPRKDLVFSNQKAKKLIGYNPKIRWHEALQKTVQWFEQ